MPVEPGIERDNAEQTQRLHSLVDRLSDADLAHNLGEGWTVAVALAHLAFWDLRAVHGLQRWVQDGTPISAADDDILNRALLDQWLALPQRRAAALAVAAARAVDGVVKSLPDHVVTAVLGREYDWLLHRGQHRREHLEQIERALSD